MSRQHPSQQVHEPSTSHEAPHPFHHEPRRAGYAPAYSHSVFGDEQTQAAHEALQHLLNGHEPYPAVVLDRSGVIVLANQSVGVLLEGVAPALLKPPVNVYRLSLHPDGLASRIQNREQWTAHLAHRLARLARLTADPQLTELLTEIRRYPGVAAALSHQLEPLSRELLLTLQLSHPAGDLHLHTTITSFGTPHDVTLAELAVESFFPADVATRQVLQGLAVPAEPPPAQENP